MKFHQRLAFSQFDRTIFTGASYNTYWGIIPLDVFLRGGLESVLGLCCNRLSPDPNPGGTGADFASHDFAYETVLFQRKATSFLSEFLEFCVNFNK